MAVTYEPIASITIASGGVADTSFSNLPQTYTDLIVVIVGTSENANAGTWNVTAQFNGDTASNYSGTGLVGNGSTASSNRATSQTANIVSALPSSSSTAITPGVNVFQVMSYSNSNVFKTILVAGGSDQFIYRRVELYRSTAAITSMKLIGGGPADLAAGTTVNIFGVRAA